MFPDSLLPYPDHVPEHLKRDKAVWTALVLHEKINESLFPAVPEPDLPDQVREMLPEVFVDKGVLCKLKRWEESIVSVREGRFFT